MEYDEQDARRFWAKVRKAGGNECWIWTATTNGEYGRFWAKGRLRQARRVAVELTTGKPLGEDVLYETCGNPLCVNPAHMRNASADYRRHRLGRQPRGEESGRHKLTEAQVLDIRRRVSQGEPQKNLALAYGVHKSTIHLIVRRKGWTYLLDNQQQ